MNHILHIRNRIVVVVVFSGFVAISGDCFADALVIERQAKVHSDRVTSIVVDTQSSRFISGSRDGSVAVWSKGPSAKVLKCRGEVVSLSILRNSGLLAVGMNCGLEVWNIQDGIRTEVRNAIRGEVTCVGDHEKILVTNSGSGSRPRASLVVPHEGGRSIGFEQVEREHSDWRTYDRYAASAVSPDTQIVALAMQNSIELYDCSTQRCIKTLSCTFERGYVAGGDSDHFCCMAFSPNGELLAATNTTGYVVVWSTGSWDGVRTFDCRCNLRGMSFSPDGSMLAIVGDGLRTIDVRAGEIATLVDRFAKSERGSAVAFSPSGEHLAIGGQNGAIDFVTLKRP